jgi:hypothetical protein
MTNTLSLYVIEDGLAELLLAREDALADLARFEAQVRPNLGQDLECDLLEARQALEAISKTLGEYMTLEATKVDNYHRFFTMAESLVEQIKAEETKLAGRRHRLEKAIAWLKERAVAAMGAAKKKRIEGTAGRSLALIANGGRAPLVVDGWDGVKWILNTKDTVLEDKFLDVTVTMPGHLLRRLMDIEGIESIVVAKESRPANLRIRAALAKPCEVCHGHGAVDSPNGDGRRLPCQACDAGYQRVPGARLGLRGEHLEVR